ncbi:hypothetical protein ACKI10_06910 [Streptomyces galilaeus]
MDATAACRTVRRAAYRIPPVSPVVRPIGRPVSPVVLMHAS